MSDRMISVGGLDPAHAIAERLELPLLAGIGATSVCFQAVDTAATLRRGVAIIGPKGSGKSVGLEAAIRLFRDIERVKKEEDATYRPRGLLHSQLLPRADYRDTALGIASAMAKTYSERVRGRKKTNPEVLNDVVQLCRAQKKTVLVLDEVEECTDATLLFLRDLMSGVEQLDRRHEDGPSRASGIGVVIVGDASLQQRLEANLEAMHRWVTTLEVPVVTPDAVASLLLHWFPGFAAHVSEVGFEAWKNYVGGAFGGLGRLNLRMVENASRLYALHITRRNADIQHQGQIPFDYPYFEKAIEEATWAVPNAIEASARPAPKRLGRREA